MSAEFDQLVAEFEKFQAKMKRADERFSNAGAMQEQLSELEAKATSADRSVTVVAGPGGAIKDIRITEAALAQGANTLSQAIMSTLRDAVADVARRQAGIVQEFMGPDNAIVDQVLETQAEVYGTSVAELRSNIETPAASGGDRTDEDSTESVFTDTETPMSTMLPSSDGDEYLKNLSDEEE